MAYSAVCAEFTRVEAGRKCSQKKNEHVSIVICFFDCIQPGSRNVVRRVQHEEFEASQFRYN